MGTYPGINRKSRVFNPDPGFISSATWPSMPKKHYNGLNQKKHNISLQMTFLSNTVSYRT